MIKGTSRSYIVHQAFRFRKKSIMIVYVDYIIITGDGTHEIEDLKKRVSIEFEIKDLGALLITSLVWRLRVANKGSSLDRYVCSTEGIE